MCVAHFKSKEPESKRPRICLEEGRAATMMMNYTIFRPAHAVPLASARQHPEDQQENRAGHSSERAVEGLGG